MTHCRDVALRDRALFHFEDVRHVVVVGRSFLSQQYPYPYRYSACDQAHFDEAEDWRLGPAIRQPQHGGAAPGDEARGFTGMQLEGPAMP